MTDVRNIQAGAVGTAPVAARAEFTARFMPKMVLLMPTLVLMTLAAGFQLALKLGNLSPASPNHAWLVASFCVVGVMAVIALDVPLIIAFTVARYASPAGYAGSLPDVSQPT